MDYYQVKEIRKFLFFTYEKTVYASSSAGTVGLYMWGKDFVKYNFYKNGFSVSKENLIDGNIDFFVYLLESE